MKKKFSKIGLMVSTVAMASMLVVPFASAATEDVTPTSATVEATTTSAVTDATTTSATTDATTTSATTSDIKNSDVLAYWGSDIADHWAYNELNLAISANILKGKGTEANGTTIVKPNDPVTRAEFVTMLVRALDLKQTGTAKDFSDVKSTDWFAQAVGIASSTGIVQGQTETTFAPNKEVRRDEIAAIVYRAFKDSVSEKQSSKVFNDVTNYWAKEAIDGVSKRKLVEGFEDGTFKPSKTATRAEAIVILMRALQNESVTLPSDNDLVSIAKNYELDSLTAIQSKDVNQLFAVNDASTTGAFWTKNAYAIQMIRDAIKFGASIDVKLDGTISGNVVQKSDRFAIVKLSGATLTTTSTYAADDVEVSEDTLERQYFLKKTTDGIWKVYLVV